MNYEGILEFHGTWRSSPGAGSQNVSRYLSDDKIHIVAAPVPRQNDPRHRTDQTPECEHAHFGTLHHDSGTVGSKDSGSLFMRRIRTGGYVSLSLKQPKAITVATYQALHSAMTRFCGTETPGEDTAPTDSEEVDYSDFD